MSRPRPRPGATGARARYVRRVTPADVHQRVSVRHLVHDPQRGPSPTDVVGRLLAADEDVLLIVDRAGRLHVIDATLVVASRVVPPHPRLPPEPDVGTREQPLPRQAARVLLLDPSDRVLLVAHAPESTERLWTAPGGGLEGGETHLECARRELAEELDLRPELGAWIWWRRVTFAFRSVWIDQEERWFLARTGQRSPTPTVDDAPLADPAAVAAHWWTLDELTSTAALLAPRALPDHLATLLRDGPPSEPVDVGR